MKRRPHTSINLRTRALRVESLEDRRLLALTPELVMDIFPGNTTDGLPFASQPHFLTRIDDTLYFAATVEENREQVWRLDAPSQTTRVIYDPGAAGYFPEDSKFVREMEAVNGCLFFTNSNSWSEGGLYFVDGDSETASLLREGGCDYSGVCDSQSSIAGANGRLFFQSGGEPWTSDGTAVGTFLIKDLYPGGYLDSGEFIRHESRPSGFSPVNGTVLFHANTESGRNIWRTDGTNVGTQLLQNDCASAGSVSCATVLFPEYYEAAISSFPHADRAFFVANDGLHGIGDELWITDGTSSGTHLVKDIYPGYMSSLSVETLSWGNLSDRVFFPADDGQAGEELWVSDGTPEGTHLVKDILTGPGSASIRQLAALGAQLAFSAQDGAHGSELWITDGSSEGTVLLRDIRPGGVGSGPKHMTSVGPKLFFVANDGFHGEELWVTDGTESGTYLVGDLLPGSAGSAPTELTAVGNTLYFTADDGIHGRELWKVVVEDDTMAGDTDADGDVDLDDLNNVRSHFGEVGEGVVGDTAPFDGQVNLDDLNAVRNYFGSSPGAQTLKRDSSRVIPYGDVTTTSDTNRSEMAKSTGRYSAMGDAVDVLFSRLASGGTYSLTSLPLSRRKPVR